MGIWSKKIQHWLGLDGLGGHESVPPPPASASPAEQESSAAASPEAGSKDDVATLEPRASTRIEEEPREDERREDDRLLEIEGEADEIVENADVDDDSTGLEADSNPVTEEIGDRRHEQRIEHYGWARFTAGDAAGEGLVTNLSFSGALVERATELLAAGTKFDLRLKPAGGFDTLDLDAEVVREMEGGFAFRFTRIDVEVYAVLREVISGGPSKA